MKKLNFGLYLFLVITSFIITSCSDDDNNVAASETFIRFTIADTDYDFKDIISAESLSLTLNGNNGEGISNVGDTQISIFMPVQPVEGSFEFLGTFEGDHRLSFSSEELGFDFNFAQSGSITITSVEGDVVSGTFSATITSDNDTTIMITNGSFRGFTF